MKTEPQTKYSLQTIVDEAVERLLDERMALGLSSPESFTAIAQARTRILAALEAAAGPRTDVQSCPDHPDGCYESDALMRPPEAAAGPRDERLREALEAYARAHENWLDPEADGCPESIALRAALAGTGAER